MNPRQQSECRVLPEMPELYFSPDLKGYGWCVRKGDYLNVGLGRRDPRGLPAHIEEFQEFLARRKAIPADAPRRWQGHAYLLYEPVGRPVVGDGVLLVGDAAGLAAPSSGEGIRPAVESGILAADTVLGANGRFGRDDLATYQEALQDRFGRRHRRVELPTCLAKLAGRYLLGSRWFARHLVLDRWFLQARRPPLAVGTRTPATLPSCA